MDRRLTVQPVEINFLIVLHTIVKKETKETNYWLGIIYETNEGFQLKMKDIVREGKEIEAIVSSIVQKDDRIRK